MAASLPGSHDQSFNAAFDRDIASAQIQSAYAEELLNTLARFIQNLLNHPVDNNRHSIHEPANKTHGQQLLDVLESYIHANFSPQSTDVSDSDRTFGLEDTEVVNAPAVLPIEISAQIDTFDNSLRQGDEQETIRWHVFNKMPIRLLAFNDHGSSIELIERSEIARRLQYEFRRCEKTRSGQPHTPKEFLQRYASYAILSHTWIRETPGDVVYSDWNTRKRNQRGYIKIVKFCEVAARDHGVNLAWMDTICINKDSSSELDESIRSMYKWYREASVCVVYLSETRALKAMVEDSWFTRGWTLQELLAPKEIEFYDTDWETMAYDGEYPDLPFPVDAEVQRHIQQATTITRHELELCRQGSIGFIPISRRMQLAAGRNVTREEDEVYSLMGILGANISVSYGEGVERAFSRLLRELILSQKDILDIFNYDFDRRKDSDDLIPSGVWYYQHRSHLFDNTGHRKASLLDEWQPFEPIVITHLGIRIPLLLIPGLRKNAGSNTEPIQKFFGEVSLDSGAMRYCLLDSQLFSHDFFGTQGHRVEQDQSLFYPLVITFGVINFGVDGSNILLPRHCLSIPLNCGTLEVGAVDSSDKIKLIPERNPTVFELKSLDEKNYVRKKELGKHGIQLITLYL